MMKIQVWSHVDKEYLMPTSWSYKAKPKEVVYPRVSIAAVFNGKQTLFGVAVLHPEDIDIKQIGHEEAIQNALINPVMVLKSSNELNQAIFHEHAWALYHHIFNKLKPRQVSDCTLRDICINSSCDALEEFSGVQWENNSDYTDWNSSWDY